MYRRLCIIKLISCDEADVMMWCIVDGVIM